MAKNTFTPGRRQNPCWQKIRSSSLPPTPAPIPRSSPGQRAEVWDVDGKKFLDSTPASPSAAPATATRRGESIQKQAATLIHMSAPIFITLPDSAGGKLASLSRPGMTPKRFLQLRHGGRRSRDEARRYATGRSKFISFFGSFHGRTFGALSLTLPSIPEKGFGTLLAGVEHAHYAYCYRCPFNLDYPPARSPARIILINSFQKTMRPTNGGNSYRSHSRGRSYVVPPADFLTRVAEISQKKRHPAHLRRTQSGMGRTGKMSPASTSA